MDDASVEGSIEYGLADTNDEDEFVKNISQAGYDSVYVSGGDNIADEVIVFSPKQIKSADIFTGTPLAERFNEDDDRITFSHAVQAYDPNQKRAEKGADNGGQWVKEGGGGSTKKTKKETEGGFDLAYNREKNKTPLTSKKMKGGYSLEIYSAHSNNPFANDGNVFAMDGDKVVGHLGINYLDEHGDIIHSKEKASSFEGAIEVHPNHRGKGIATELYLFAEQYHGVIAKPASDHSADAKRMWKRIRDSRNKKLESANATRPTIDQLSDNVLESLTGVTREWLSPVRPHFEKLAAMAMSKQVSDADFIEALEKSQRDIPELFDKLNVEALQTHMNDAIGTAMIAGSVERYEAGEVKAAYDPNQPRDPGGEGGGQWVKEGEAGDSDADYLAAVEAGDTRREC